MADKNYSRDEIYVEGPTVRTLEAEEVPQEEPQRRRAGQTTRERQERALQMNLPYVLFLTAAAVITVFVCVNFLQLRAKGTLLQEEVAVLEAELDSAVLENDSEYNRVMNNVDLEHVKDVAVNELGMKKASSKQVVTYELEDGDYVRQYAEIPAE